MTRSETILGGSRCACLRAIPGRLKSTEPRIALQDDLDTALTSDADRQQDS